MSPLPEISALLPLRSLDWRPPTPVKETKPTKRRRRRPEIEGSLKIGTHDFPIVLKLDLLQLLDAIETLSEEKQNV